MADFSTQVDEWIAKCEVRATATFRRAVELLADELTTPVRNGGRLPHRTGNLMRSLLATTSAPPTVGLPGAQYPASDVGIVTAQLTLGEKVYLGYQAVYARRVNYGFVGPDSLGRVYNQQGAHFVEYAVAKWPQIVKDAAAEIYNG